MFDAQDVGGRIRLLRVVLGLDQAGLGRRTGLDQAQVSRIENGRATLTADTLSALAQGLDCTPSFLTNPPEVIPPKRPWLRASADAPKREVDRRLAECQMVSEVIERTGLHTLDDNVPVFDEDPQDEEAIETFAGRVREAAGLDDDRPVGHTIRLAERLGCIVLPMDDELGRHLGMSTYADLRPMICVSRGSASLPGDRQRLTVAHEIGHLGLHRTARAPETPAEAQRIERQANRFAGALLIPGDALHAEIDEFGGRVTLKTLAHIKARWGIAIKALVVRSRQLGIIDDHQARSLYKQISSRGWNKGEPVEVGHESGLWLTKAIKKAAGHTSDAVSDVASQAGLGRSHLERWLRWELATDATVVELPTRSDASGRPAGVPATEGAVAEFRLRR